MVRLSAMYHAYFTDASYYCQRTADFTRKMRCEFLTSLLDDKNVEHESDYSTTTRRNRCSNSPRIMAVAPQTRWPCTLYHGTRSIYPFKSQSSVTFRVSSNSQITGHSTISATSAASGCQS